MKTITTIKFILATSFVLTAYPAQADSKKTEASDSFHCTSCDDMLAGEQAIMGLQMPTKKLAKTPSPNAVQDRKTIADIQQRAKEQNVILDNMSSQIRAFADVCTTDKIQQILDLSDQLYDPDQPAAYYTPTQGNNAASLAAAGFHTNLVSKRIVTPEQDRLLLNFYSSSAMQEFAKCQQIAILRTKAVCTNLPKEAHQTLTELFKGLFQADSKNKEQTEKMKSHKKYMHVQNECTHPENLFEATKTVLDDPLLKDGSSRMASYPRAVYAIKRVYRKPKPTVVPTSVEPEAAPVVEPIANDLPTTAILAPTTTTGDN